MGCQQVEQLMLMHGQRVWSGLIPTGQATNQDLSGLVAGTYDVV
jgi:hypothetical protein